MGVPSPFEVPLAASRIMRPFEGSWGICGGWGIDLWLGRVTRNHSDVDISVLREDWPRVHAHLHSAGWDLEQVRAGTTEAWGADQPLDETTFNVFCRNPSVEPGFMEVLFERVDSGSMVYRREPAIRLPVSRAYTLVPPGVPVLAPELIILYMAKYPGPDRDQIIREVVGRLDLGARRWLADALCRAHPDSQWLSGLGRGDD